MLWTLLLVLLMWLMMLLLMMMMMLLLLLLLRLRLLLMLRSHHTRLLTLHRHLRKMLLLSIALLRLGMTLLEHTLLYQGRCTLLCQLGGVGISAIIARPIGGLCLRSIVCDRRCIAGLRLDWHIGEVERLWRTGGRHLQVGFHV